MYASFKEMPPVLKFLTGMAIFFVFLFLKATIPGMFGTFTYNGEVLEFNGIWERGFGVPLILIGLLVPLAGVSVLLKQKYSRHFYCFALAVAVSMPAVAERGFYALTFFLIVPVAAAVYLFSFNEVRRYYGT
jgi:hypothetical protein